MIQFTNLTHATMPNRPTPTPDALCPPAHLMPFLTAKGSLTARLEALCDKPLGVTVHQERYRPLTFDEKKYLGLPVHRPMLAWERQVLLFGDGEPWVQATSLFPLPSLHGNAKRLRHLGRTPIGYVLFKKNRQLPNKRYYYDDKGRFGRKTVYEWQGRTLLIDELFLAEFEQALLAKG